jgi:1,4-alpha-glucan branching enzyme
MPYVEGFDTWPFGEEWLWEAVATVYLPLLELLEELDPAVTLGLTPVLCDQLETLPGAAGERLEKFLGETRQIVHDEDRLAFERSAEHELAAEVRRAGGDYERALAALRQRGGRLLDAFARLAARGRLELWTSAASHPILPLLATDAGLDLQIATGIASHEARFGGFHGGFWLPECAYAPGLERVLADHGVGVFCLDATHTHGQGAHEHLEPVITEAGVTAMPIDWQTVELVWNESSGYPTTPGYRDYHRRTTYDLRPWSTTGDAYRPGDARELAAQHAREFVASSIERLDGYAVQRGRPGLLCCALDTELLGHWWYEGQTWLRCVIAEAEAQGLDLVTVSEGLERVPPVARELRASSWGEGKDLRTWDSPRVAELAFAARRAELSTVAASAGRGCALPALARAARELLALQASDWAFHVTRDVAGDYPARRVAAHAAAHGEALAAAHRQAPVPEATLRNLAPHLELAPLTAP